MLKKKAFNRIFLTTIVFFLVFSLYTLKDVNYSDKEMEVFNPNTMHLKSFPAVVRNCILPNTFGKMFEFLVGNESKAFWTDKTAKDLFVK